MGETISKAIDLTPRRSCLSRNDPEGDQNVELLREAEAIGLFTDCRRGQHEEAIQEGLEYKVASDDPRDIVGCSESLKELQLIDRLGFATSRHSPRV